MTFQPETHKIIMDGRWELQDLYLFPHYYTEVYSFLYAVEVSATTLGLSFQDAFQRYPWRGGYSSIGFYNDLYSEIPKAHQPQIISIKYASPGCIELALMLAIATQIEKIVITLVKGWDKVDHIYTRIHRRAMKRKLLALDVKNKERKLDREELVFVQESVRELSDSMGFQNAEQVQNLTRDWLSTLKILLAFYRRLSELRVFYQQGKVKLKDLNCNPSIEGSSPTSADSQQPRNP